MPESANSLLLEQLVGQAVVVDVSSPYVFVGTLAEIDHKYLILTEADAHDLRDTTTTRDLYTLDAKRHGVNVNRKRVLVDRMQVVSVSLLDDVIE